MYYSPEYQALINVARTYAEGFKDVDKDKLKKMRSQSENKPDTDEGKKQQNKINQVRKVFKNTEMNPIAKEAVTSTEKTNRLTGQKKAIRRAYNNSGVRANKARNELNKRSLEQSYKAKPNRPQSRMPKHNSPGTIKKD